MPTNNMCLCVETLYFWEEEEEEEDGRHGVAERGCAVRGVRTCALQEACRHTWALERGHTSVAARDGQADGCSCKIAPVSVLQDLVGTCAGQGGACVVGHTGPTALLGRQSGGRLMETV